MKPKVFIGSSGEAHEYASAIQAQLDKVAECTPWTAGAFELSESTLQNLIANVRDSDFGVFVFAPDDTTTKRDSLLHSPRDNVIFEAGIFAGYLGPERCFIAIPQQARIHLPSDLLGISLGHYEDDRSDDDERSAVNSFCREIRKRIEDRGLFRGSPRETLRGLATKFDCCKWISDKDDRVKRRGEISYEIEVFCRNTRVNKHRLLAENSPGYAIALLAAIQIKPKANDWKLIKQMKAEALPSGFVHYKLLDTVEALKTNSKITAQPLLDLQVWLKALPDQDDVIKKRVNLLAP